jgi:LacI family transcriptional regulator, galactose operon repressor
MKKSTNRDEVARLAGVSPATISYVINNGPRPVSPETRARVLDAIQKLGYQPNAVARNLRRQRTTTLGVILPDTQNPYFAEVTREIERTAFARGYTVVQCHSDYSLERELQFVDLLYAERAAGVIWIPTTDSSDPAVRLADLDIPFVVLDRRVGNVTAPAVLANNCEGARMATQHLLDLGHRRIGYIGRPFELSHSSERTRGFLEALDRNGLRPDETLMARGGFRIEDGRVAALQLLERKDRPSAIFAYSDFMAIGALRAAWECGLAVPRDVSVIGFDDIPQAALTCPALSTISQPKTEMGRRGSELILDLIEEKLIREPEPLGVKLIVRESTGLASSSRSS